jgi:3-oxoadipate enol-lactonase
LSYRVEGTAGGPALLLSNALGTTCDLWTRQLGAFGAAFQVILYDTRGHGASAAPVGEYTLDQLGRDAVAVLDAVGVERAHVCGVSLGGMTAMWLGLHAADRVERLILASTAARIGTRELWQDRINLIRAKGLGAVAEAAPGRWFTEPFRQRRADVVSRFQSALAAGSPDGYIGCAAALRDADLCAAIDRMTAPVLVVSGQSDVATPPSQADFLCQRIAGAGRVDLTAAHLSNVEDADVFTAAALEFLNIEDRQWTRRYGKRRE